MVLQQPQATVCLGSQSLEPSSGVAQLEAEIPQLTEALRQRKQIGVATGLLARRFAITPEQAWTLAAANADHQASGVANLELRIVKDQP
jgi:AmiR/NasT family two-component response regulator